MKKKFFITILLSVIILFTTGLNPIQAETIKDETQANSYCARGDKILNYYEQLTDKKDAQKYLNAAKYYYYQASRVDISNQNSLVGMARISLYQGKTRDAKNALMIALNVDERNPKVSYYIGEAFFMEGEYFQAIDFYTWAYSHGYQKDYNTNFKLGVCYEKLNDIDKAKLHYQNAINARPDSTEAKQRLKGLNTIDTDYKNIKNKDIKNPSEDYKIDKSDLEKLNMPNL